MKKVIALGGSNSKSSINKVLATYAANQVENVEVIVIDLNSFDLPLYGIDLENEKGIPEDATRLNSQLDVVDGFVVSLAEHNGSYSAAFKNTYDWMSRINPKVWRNKPMLLMATSPGGRGGATVLQAASAGFPYLGANVVATFSLPSFYDNFSEEGIKDEALSEDLKAKVAMFEAAVHQEEETK